MAEEAKDLLVGSQDAASVWLALAATEERKGIGYLGGVARAAKPGARRE